MMILLQFAPSGGTMALIIAVSFFLVLAGAAYIAFKALAKTVKWAFRIVIVAVILMVAVVGSISLWYFSMDASPKLKPPANRR